MQIPYVNDGASLAELTRVVRELSEAVRLLESRIKDNTDGWAGGQTNVTPDRSYDANATSTAELADVLGTLIADMIEIGILK